MSRYTNDDIRKVRKMRETMSYNAIADELEIPFGSVVHLSRRPLYGEKVVDSLDEFLITSNEIANGSVLDVAYKCKDLSELPISELHASDIELLQALVKLFCIRLYKSDVCPIHEVGEILELTLADSEKYDYNGSDFQDAEERKSVKVVAPGWKHGKVEISPPRVVEVAG